MLYFQLSLIKLYVQFSRTRLSQSPGGPSGIVSLRISESSPEFSAFTQSPLLLSLRNVMKASPLPSLKVMLSLSYMRYHEQFQLPYKPDVISFPYIHRLLPCWASAGVSRTTPEVYLLVLAIIVTVSVASFLQDTRFSISLPHLNEDKYHSLRLRVSVWLPLFL